MSDERQFIERVGRELEAQLEHQSPALQGRLRAARREALASGSGVTPRRHWLPAVAASFFVVVAAGTVWYQLSERPDTALESLLQTATAGDLQLLNEGDDIEFYRDLEFYYWLEQEQNHAG